MLKERFKAVIAVHLLLIQEGDILLQLRKGTGWCDGLYSVVAGHIEGDETVRAGMAREACEEIGIAIDPRDLVMSLTMHRKTHDREIIDFFFTPLQWQNSIYNREPHKCEELSFFPLNQLPTNVVPYVAKAIECSQKKLQFIEYGWESF